jgi:hypothetical protein
MTGILVTIMHGGPVSTIARLIVEALMSSA